MSAITIAREQAAVDFLNAHNPIYTADALIKARAVLI